MYSTIRLLTASTGTMTTEFLWLHASWVSNEETLVVLNKHLLKFTLGGLVHVLLVVGNEGLGDGHADGHNLGSPTATTDADTDVQVFKASSTKEEDWLENFESEGGWLQKVKWLSVNFDEAATFGTVSNSGGVLLSAEALNLFALLGHLSLSLIVL